MSKTIIIHMADTHLGYRQYNNIQRSQDFFDAFERVIDDAINMNVNAVVHAGDLFDSRIPTLIDIVQTVQILKKLRAANIPFLGIVGNHESKQDAQWLDLLEEMDIAKRLDIKPVYINDVAIYGIDAIPRTKLPLFNFGELVLPSSETRHTILAMHQLITEVPCGIFNHRRTISEIPFNLDALILGDYHKYVCDKIGHTWITYSGSTERNSSDEFETRSYNILTCDENGISVQKKNIVTRDFVYIKDITISERCDNPIDYVMSRIKERMSAIPGSVVILEIDGDYKGVIPFTEIDEYLLSKGAIVCKFHDKRFIQEVLGVSISDNIVFLDPDKAVDEKLRMIPLSQGGCIADSVIRNINISKSKVDSEIEEAIEKHMKNVDFNQIGTYSSDYKAQAVSSDENGYMDKMEISEVEVVSSSDNKHNSLLKSNI